MQSSANLRGLEWMEVQIDSDAQVASELELALTARRLGGWVVEEQAERLRWVCYVPCESGWEVRLAAISDEARTLGATVSVRRSIVDEDWAECWKKFYHPRKIGDRLVICPSWEEYAPKPGEHVLTIDPGMAFGTGYHASTSMCMQLIQQIAGQVCMDEVLDVGVGSGILSVSALLMGAKQVTCVDNDPVAVRVAGENLAINGFADKSKVLEYTGVLPGQYDLVLANLVAALLRQLAADLAAAVKPEGRLIASGIIEERRDEVAEAFAAVGLVVDSELNTEGWVSLCLRKACDKLESVAQ